MKRVRFWGTRGSLPVSLTAAAVRREVAAAVRGASGRSFATIATSTNTSTGWASPSPERSAATLRACRSRPAARTTCCATWAAARAVRPGGAGAARTGVPADVPHLHVAPALGSHHGPAVLHAGLHSRQYGAHLRRPPRARGGAAAAEGTAFVPCRFLVASRGHRVRPSRARQPPRDRRHDGHDVASSGMVATPMAIVSRQMAGRSSTRPIPSTRSPTRTRPRDSSRSSAVPTSSSSMGCTRSPRRYRSRRTGATRATSSASSCASWRQRGICACFTTSPRTTTRRLPACSTTRAGSRRSPAPACVAHIRGLRRDGNRVVSSCGGVGGSREAVRPHPRRRNTAARGARRGNLDRAA